MFRCQKKTQKGVNIYHSDTRAIWKRFDNDVKRTTHIFEGILIDPFDNNNPSDHLLNFASGVVTTSAIKEILLKALDKGSQVSVNSTKKHLIISENNLQLRSYYHPLPKSDIKVMTEMQKKTKKKKKKKKKKKNSPHPIQQCNNQQSSNVF